MTKTHKVLGAKQHGITASSSFEIHPVFLHSSSLFCHTLSDGEFEVAKRLSNQDLVGNPAAFYVHMQLMKREGTDMQKGIYTLNSSMTYEEIIRVIYGL